MDRMQLMLQLAKATMLVDLVLMILSFMKRTPTGRALGVTLAACMCCTGSYFCSIFFSDITQYAIFQGVYFSCVTTTLLAILRFMILYSNATEQPDIKIVWRCVLGLGIADTVIQLTNFIHHGALWYEPVQREVNRFAYVPGVLFSAHLVLCYLLVVLILALMVYQTLKAPVGYRKKYILAIVIILGIVAINFFYLFSQESKLSSVDYSLLAYSLGALSFYWLIFRYNRTGMVKAYQSWVFDSLYQAVLLFDYEDRLIMHNKAAETVMPMISMTDEMTTDAFLRETGLAEKLDLQQEQASIQFYQQSSGYDKPMRCEYHALKDRRGRAMGRLFVVAPVLQEFDLLTGFYTWDFFRFLFPDSTRPTDDVGACVMCDINGLSSINERYGHAAGDQVLHRLATLMRELFPKEAVYLRCGQANLALICRRLDEKDAKARLARLHERLEQLPEDQRFRVQTAVLAMPKGSGAPQSVERTMRIIRVKKLMDRSARHSDLLNSIIQILQECDQDTEAHVQRTQKMCFGLGRRLGLGDDDLSHLSLLAILHDIGKVGVPLDVLNKPGKLTSAEWNVIKGHVEKGARIAASSAELRDISELILCHHERWDGKGYPAGLSKESIPLLSRIISVVDSYDAMVYNRSYRKAMGPERARAELKRCAGTQFDPTIVSAMLEMLEEQEAASGENSQTDGAAGNEPAFIPSEWSVRAVQDNAPDHNAYPMPYSRYVMDHQGRIVTVDERFGELTGYTWEDVQAVKLGQRDLLPVEDWQEYTRLVARFRSPDGTAYIEHRLVRKDGAVINVFCLGRDFYDSVNRGTYTEIFVCNALESHAVQELLELQHTQASRRLEIWENKYRQDSLTGLLNHEAFMNDVQKRMIAEKGRAMMVMMDLDHFKQYNDTFGHRAGDEFLILCAQTLQGILQEKDLVSRMGGDEFAAMLFFPEDTPDETMIRKGEQLCARMNLLLSARSQGKSGVSCGGAFYGPNTMVFDRLYEAADQALYRSKQKGRGVFSM